MRHQGPRIAIRPVEREDLPLLHRWWSDPRVMREVRAERLSVSLEDLQVRYREEWRGGRPDACRQFMILLEERPVGEIGYRPEGGDSRTVAPGIKIAEPDLWGRGLGTEAFRVFLDHLFGEIGARRIIGRVGAWNERSLRMCRSLGFREIGREEQPPAGIFDGGIVVTLELARPAPV